MRFFYTAILLVACFVASAQVIPNELIVSREPRPELKLTGPEAVALSTLSNGTIVPVFGSCVDGNYFVAIQLYYDLGNTQTEVNWTADLNISFRDNTTPLWNKTLSLANTTQSVTTPTQIFVSTAFHQSALNCSNNYNIKVETKNLTGTVPQGNVLLKILLYKKEDYVNNPFVPLTTGTMNCAPGAEKNLLTWNYTGNAVIAYDVEWVYIAEHETSYTGNLASDAFKFKEPARVTVASAPYSHSVHYPDGKLWYRVRAVGYNPDFPEHRIPGIWIYGPDAGTPVTNHQPNITWQAQTIFAEQGKYKKIMTYYDETLRQRQQQTNLSTSGDTTLVGESFYDYEGRASVTMMAVPAASVSLSYKPAFNTFATSQDATVAAHTSPTKRKFHYDNAGLANSTMATTTGAGKYYSSANDLVQFRRNYIPDAEGFVYSQQEYTNDGTGRVKRQSGVGKEFRMDGPHMSKYFYGQASKAELVRLFGTNVGDSAHYKKNLVIDNNGQVSVSYLDQEGRVIATALAGTKPASVASLPSYDQLDTDAIEESMADKNILNGGSKVITHKILNVDVNTEFLFKYDFSAKGSMLSIFGCVDCTFDLKITITDPDGKPLNINSPTVIAGNQATDVYSYVRKGLTVTGCSNPTTAVDIEFPVLFQEIGDYTITKVLTPGKMTYSQIKTIVETHQSVQIKKQRILDTHVVDESDCEICVSNCPETDSLINNTIGEIADQDCENKRRIIIQALREQYPDSVEYQPSQSQIEGHPDYCDYELCIASKPSDVFEKKLARISNWAEALGQHYNDLASVSTSPYPDPLFQTGALGASYKSALQARLDNVYVGTMGFDTNSDGDPDGTQDYFGAISDVTNPLDPDFYIDGDGNATGSNTVGEHMLYLEVMRRHKAGYMSETAYQTELLKLRWTYFKSFYLEAKRKTKLEIPDFANCAAAKNSLELVANLPTSEGGVSDYGDENGVLEPITEPELKNYFASFKFSCSNKHITASDSLLIINHLTAYFNGKPPSLFKFILTPDLNADPNLAAIQTILNSYGCAQLSKFAEIDPFSCVKDTTITYRNHLVEQTGGQSMMMMGAESARMSAEDARAMESLMDPVKQKLAKDIENAKDEAIKARLPKVETFSLMTSPVESTKGSQKNSRSAPVPAFNLTTTTSEYNALMDLFNATGGPNWTNKTGWGDANAPTWYGVVQDANGHIIQLNLFQNNLIGTIPASIANLTYLQRLHITNNQLSGSFPSGILSLANLKELYLSANSFSGNLPANFNGLTSINYLSLSYNQFSGPIPSGIGSMTTLLNLALNNNQFSGSIPSQITSLVNLKGLFLNSNQLTGSLPAALNMFVNLEDFQFHANQISGTIPSQIGGMVKVRTIVGDGNALTGGLPSTIGNLKQLYLITLSSNQLSGTIPAEIGEMTSAMFINLGNNGFTGSIPPSMGNLSNLEGLYLNGNQLSGNLPAELGSLHKLQTFYFQTNQISGSIPWEFGDMTDIRVIIGDNNDLSGPLPGSVGSWSKLYLLSLSGNELTGPLPSSIGGWTSLLTISLGHNLITGPLPSTIGKWKNIQLLDLSYNQLSGSLPAALGSLKNLDICYLQSNKFTGSIPTEMGGLSKVRYLYLFDNRLSGPVPVSMSTLPMIYQFLFHYNKFTFTDILPFKQAYTPSLSTLIYGPHDSVDVRKKITVIPGSSHTLTTSIDRSTTPASTFQWFQYVNGTSDIALNTESVNGHTLTLSNIQASDNGKRYYYKIKNTDASAFTLVSRLRKLVVDTATFKTTTICVLPDTANATLKKFSFVVKWSEVVQQCLDSAAKENQILIDIAFEKVIDSVATSFLQEQTSNCFRGMTENFTYTYVPREYHYTLYYYDQADNLVQTVPPEGVNTDGSGVHALITRYQYNSLNQVIWQKTPDAGESQFWYNDKGQIRFSQNAQQFKDNSYSYTKHDRQGRIAEVGKMIGTTVATLIDSLQSVNFPLAPTYILTDVTKTHYDFTANLSSFQQNNLRNRVAWVELMEEGYAETVATYYSYDIHGGVKSVLQHIPGLDNKRTDYSYDLVSGKVNFVFYQYGGTDQFIHKYTYDADNRLEEVVTSSDGYLWDSDARYRYYLHGPLARIELGHYRVQGLDYYYTLQAWIKGVNMPFDGDQGADGYGMSNLRVGKDVFSYALGYYENDYKAVNASVTPADTRDQLWGRYKSLMGSVNSGLYNGNISWMITDLKKIGQLDGARARGMQAMVYKYDQLHRIRQSRSLAVYTPGSGFNSRTSSPAAYDEDFTYDGNGNILTLQRRDQAGTMTDDFTYQYYNQTNKLRYHDVVTRDTIYSGAIVDNNKVFEYINVKNTAYVPAGSDATIRATTNIVFEPNPGFDLQNGAIFNAHVLRDDEGEYSYDAVGNLILDQDNGTSVNWTAFGKVHQVIRGDGTTTTFRYDGFGNRVEKKTVTTTNDIVITRYAIDAKGNVMAVYDEVNVVEKIIYGNTRLGMLKGSRETGERRLESRNFELSNHLGNVLAVITDNIHLSLDSTWSEVISSTDYHPFGLNMPGRTWNNSYRYGHNGKERDKKTEWGTANYDYGFRIYNPSIGKFLSVDPLTKGYPMLTPYQFAANRPIDGIDLDGMEWRPVNGNGENVPVDNDGNPVDANQHICDYKWEGYQYDGNGQWSRPVGTVAEGSVFIGENTMKFFGSIGVPNAIELGSTKILTLTDASSLAKISTLNENIQPKVKALLLTGEYKLGIRIRVTDGHRTYPEQDNLYAQSRTQAQLNSVGLNNVVAQPNALFVTNAFGGYSNHNFGLAVDVAFLQNGGVNWDVATYNRLGPIGQALGFDWGGTWNSPVDRPHFQIMFGNTIGQLRQMMSAGNTITRNGITIPDINNEVPGSNGIVINPTPQNNNNNNNNNNQNGPR